MKQPATARAIQDLIDGHSIIEGAINDLVDQHPELRDELVTAFDLIDTLDRKITKIKVMLKRTKRT